MQGSKGTISLYKNKKWINLFLYLKRHWSLYLILLIPTAYILLFNYYPMYGVTIAFKDFDGRLGIMGSPWVGLKYFEKFFKSPDCAEIIINTLRISIYSLIAGFPLPIILALSLNSINNQKYKKLVQTISYMPYFISTTVMVGIILQFLDMRNGLINKIIMLFGGEAQNFMSVAEWFPSIYVWSGIWQGTGWGSIIYIAVLSGVDPTYHEAAIVDGASRFKRVLYIDLPMLVPTMVIMMILNVGQIMNVGFEKVFLMQNPLNMRTSEIISTYVYKIGLASSIPNYSYSTAIGLFNSIVNLILLFLVNSFSRYFTKSSLW